MAKQLTEKEVSDHAERIVLNYLDDGIEFCQVYEDDELCDVDPETQRSIHDAADLLIRGIKL